MNNELTMFSDVPSEMLNKFYDNGFYYIDRNYINVYRWMWTDLKIHPDMKSPIGGTATMVRFYVKSKNTHINVFADSFDDAIIKSVETLYNNIDELLK